MPAKKSIRKTNKRFVSKNKTSKFKNHFWRNFVFAFLGFLFIWFILSPYADFNPSWQEPKRFVSKDGELNMSLTAQTTEMRIGGEKVKTDTYNEMYPGPVLEVKGGESINIHLENTLDQVTNLHFHGSHISPRENSDNVLLAIQPGESFDYEYHLPADHTGGLFWYHPQLYQKSEQQVLGGMAGVIIVRGDVDYLPGIRDVPEKILVLTTKDGTDQNNPVRLVNGREMPALFIRPGEMQRWRIVNASANDFYNFALPNQKLHLIARDGNTLDKVIEVDSEVIAPGDRIEILVRGGIWGTYDVESLPYSQGFARYEQSTFMHMVVAGFPVFPREFPTRLLAYDDLRNTKIHNTRTLTFSMEGEDDNPTFLFDGNSYNPNVVSQVMILGTTEEWRLINKSREVEPFHINLNPFQVISVNGKPVDRHGYDDTFAIPAKSTVVIRTRFKDFDGRYLLNSQILYHQDHGMMQNVEVIRPGHGLETDNGLADREGKSALMNTDTTEETTETSPNRYQKWQ